MQENLAGQRFISDTRYGKLVHARPRITRENSGKPVALVGQKAGGLAEKLRVDYIISVNEIYTDKIRDYCLGQGIDVVARIPYDNTVTEAMIRGVPVVEYNHDGVSHEIKALWETIARLLNK